MEFEVIPMMIRTGAACGINAIMLEWHGRSRIELKCTRWIEMDDEKYFTVADEKDKITIRKPLPLPRPRPRPQPSPIPLPPMRPLPTSAATAAFNNATRTNEPGYGPGSVQLARWASRLEQNNKNLPLYIYETFPLLLLSSALVWFLLFLFLFLFILFFNF